MKQGKNKVKVIGSGLIVVGILLAVIGLLTGAKFSIINTGDGLKAVGESDRLQEEFILEEYKNLDVDLADADIEIIPSNEFRLEIERLDGIEISHKVENEVLKISDEKSANTWFGFSMNLSGFTDKTNIKIYVPVDAELEDAKISSKFGDIHIDGISVDQWVIQATDGDVAIYDINSNGLTIENRFGDVTASDVKTHDFMIEMTDGSNEFKSIDAVNTNIKIEFGDTYFENFTSQGAKIESTDGDIEINGVLFGETMIESKFGSVYLDLANKESELSYTIKSSFGDVYVNDKELGVKASHSAKTDNKMEISTSDGDVEVTFNEE
ncbi:DUF4097 family beta strand repeat-containing protein [Ornithinibacillus scapharcae]|uniref:DUF4097 family beta strand repeat-containing protein n=1 Tax=Ornithinibacillus scapharcae TaxID=1147159 RepID=UPI000225AAEA|nr:DUF4097 family beta strand repeat-containing protein [Ornithinibacillus scapharcae]